MIDCRLGVVEARFADIVWQNAPLTTAELVKHCAAELDWKRTTTYTVLKKLSEKGLFQLENGLVTVKINREEYASLQSEQYVEEAFAGSLPAFLAAFTRRKSLSPDEIAQIRKMIDDAEKE